MFIYPRTTSNLLDRLYPDDLFLQRQRVKSTHQRYTALDLIPRRAYSTRASRRARVATIDLLQPTSLKLSDVEQ
jgi:hypothetical protein